MKFSTKAVALGLAGSAVFSTAFAGQYTGAGSTLPPYRYQPAPPNYAPKFMTPQPTPWTAPKRVTPQPSYPPCTGAGSTLGTRCR